MNVVITQRISRNKTKLYYTLEWGKAAGQRLATGLFTYVDPVSVLQKEHNKETLSLLEIKKAQMLIDAFSVGLKHIAAHRYKHNFLDFYSDYVNHNKQYGNKHLKCSYTQFKKFIRTIFLSPQDVTEDLSANFQKYLLSHFNGETPSNYFARYKRVLKAATAQGYFIVNPGVNLPVKANKNKKKKDNLEVSEYIQLLNTPSRNEEAREAFILCCYTGLRWCDVKLLTWNQLRHDSIILTLHQKKTTVEQYITLHPIAQAILNKRKNRLSIFEGSFKVFNLPSADGANKILGIWCNDAGIKKHITWNCARLSFSILLQDANVDAATVALLLGHTSTKYVNEIYKRYRPKNQMAIIQKLPS
jgi:integrase